MKTCLILVAGGKGLRAGAAIPKQYQCVAGRTVIAHALRFAANCAQIDYILPVIGADHGPLYAQSLASLPETIKERVLPPISGGETRQHSTRNGLADLPDDVSTVLVHDAARPFLQADVVDALLSATEPGVGAIPVLIIADSVKRLSGDHVVEEPDREGLVRAQTPQAFNRQDLETVFASLDDSDFTDEASAARRAGIDIIGVKGDPDLFKITHPEDFALAEKTIMLALNDIRTGQGFDVHAFEPGDQVTLCGVDIEHSKALKGHSDADVGLHALTDAILGALGAGDIGDHFPPSDAQWAGAPSYKFLQFAGQQVAQRGGIIAHVDVTLICERPKIGPHRAAMVQTIAQWLNIEETRVSVKATTTEQLGFTGREEGIAAQALATVRLP